MLHIENTAAAEVSRINMCHIPSHFIFSETREIKSHKNTVLITTLTVNLVAYINNFMGPPNR